MDSNQYATLTEWVNRHADTLFAWTRNRVKDEAIAEDLVQETFMAAFQQFDQFRKESSAITWLHAILRNKLSDHFRKEARKAIVNHDYLLEFFDDQGNWLVRSTGLQKMDDSNLVDDIDFQRMLLLCLNELPDSWAACMRLRYLEEKKAEQICQELNINPNNYWQIIHRSKLRLRNCLQTKWFNAQ